MSRASSLHWKHRPFPELARLAWPITVSMLSLSVTTVIDTAFIGRLGGASLAAVGLGGVACFTVLCFGVGLVRAAKVLGAQARGAGETRLLPLYEAGGVVLAALVGVGSALLGHGVARLLPQLTASAEAGRLASEYVTLRTLGAPAFLIGASLRESRYASGDGRSPMLTAIAANLTNVALDALFILGFGWGVRGAALASVISSLVGCVLMLLVQRRHGLPVLSVKLSHLAALWRTGVPLGLQMLLEVGAFATLVAILARIGEVDVAAHQIALQVVSLSFLPAFAIGEAASVLVGQAVGANEDRLVRRVTYLALAAAAAYTGVCGLAMAVFARPIAAAFTHDAAVRELAVRLFWVAAVFQIFDGANMIARSALRGTGDVKTPALIAVVTAWLSTPTLAWLLGVRLHLGALGGWLGLCAEIIVGAGVLWWRFERGAWRSFARASRAALAAPEPDAAEGTPVPAE